MRRAKAYVGASAGSIIMTPCIDVACIALADETFLDLRDLTGLRFAGAEIEPHCEDDRYEIIENWAVAAHRHVFAVDDQSVVVLADNQALRAVGEGKTEEYDYK